LVELLHTSFTLRSLPHILQQLWDKFSIFSLTYFAFKRAALVFYMGGQWPRYTSSARSHKVSYSNLSTFDAFFTKVVLFILNSMFKTSNLWVH